MAHYMLQFSYNSESISELIKNPQDRSGQARALVEGLGGRLETFYYTFGDYDGLAIAELPDSSSAAAASMALAASGGFTAAKTTVLITMGEAVEAMKKANGLGYQPPGR